MAFISTLKNKFDYEDDMSSIVKLGNCTFINTASNKLPQNIKNGIANNTFTPMYNKLPCSYAREEYTLSDRNWMNSGIVKCKLTIEGKQFYEFTDEFVQNIKGKIAYVLDKQKTQECFEKNQIDGFLKISNNKYLTWYKLHE